MAENHIRYDHIIFDAPVGERILINDNKPDGLTMAYALAKARDDWGKMTLNGADNLSFDDGKAD